jgi:putative hydrolase of the HAD superfamily
LLANIKTIIFDLGGVIIDLDVNRTINSFASISGLSYPEVKNLYTSDPAFTQYERGLIDSATFRNGAKKLFNSSNVPDSVLDDAWNAMLVNIPKGKLELLLKLKERYTVMILSNTNAIHVDYINKKMLPQVVTENSFDPFAHKVYYSHLLNLRKPDPKIYEHVMQENKLNGAETIFLDDNKENIGAAKEVGIGTIHIDHPDKVYEIFN